MTDALLLAGLALVGAMPVFLLVASIKRCSLEQARLETMTFLEDWGGIAPKGLKDWIKLTFGSSVAFFLLIALAYVFHLVGDGTAPRISSVFDHFNNPHVEWSVSKASDWDVIMWQVRKNWETLHPGENIEDDAVWVKWKNDRKKYQARGARTLVCFAFLLFVAGLIDVFRREKWRRGIVVAILGALFFVMMIFVWADRKEHYVKKVIAAHDSLIESLDDKFVTRDDKLETQPHSLVKLKEMLSNKQIQQTP